MSSSLASYAQMAGKYPDPCRVHMQPNCVEAEPRIGSWRHHRFKRRAASRLLLRGVGRWGSAQSGSGSVLARAPPEPELCRAGVPSASGHGPAPHSRRRQSRYPLDYESMASLRHAARRGQAAQRCDETRRGPHGGRGHRAERAEFEKYSEGGAFSADAVVVLGEHLSVRAEWLAGKRTDTPTLVPLGRGTHDFMAAWAAVSYRLDLGGKMTLIPAARAEWLDEDQPASVGQTTYFTVAMNLEFSPLARLLFDLSRSQVEVGTRTAADTAISYRPSATIGTVQLQFKR